MVTLSTNGCEIQALILAVILGDILTETVDLNYREKYTLSPIKLMCQITRKSSLYTGNLGHYELKGSMYSTHNYEFAEMAYGGTLSLFYQRGDPRNINKAKVQAAYRALQAVNPLIARYRMPKLTYSLINYHVEENREHIRVDNHWQNNALFANDDTNPQAANVDFNDLIIGEDNNGKYIRYTHPSLIALVFPWLFPKCKGHFSMVATNTDEANQRQGLYGMPEDHGGVAKSTLDGETFGSFVKSQLLMKDRRFGTDPSFLFFLLDCLEKKNIGSANRFVVSSKGKSNLKQKDVVNSATGKLNYNLVSHVPLQIRSSYAYKRRNFLDLQCVFENLGAPQLFLTFTCDDNSLDFVGLTGGNQHHAWEDPVLFSLHFKRKWQEFFRIHILKHFASQIGGIKDYSWVMEIQDRGSPHIHCVLWTKKSVPELVQDKVVHTWFPEGGSNSDPLLYNLVTKLQIHRCNDRY